MMKPLMRRTRLIHGTDRSTTAIWEEADLKLDASRFSFEETTYRSKDGTAIPVFLSARADLLRHGPMPTFLTGYGGFGTSVTPRFSTFATFLMEQGLLFAVAAIRGGGELGERWHLGAKGHNRQNSFDDFIAAAEWLGAEGLSSPDQIAAGGRLKCRPPGGSRDYSKT